MSYSVIEWLLACLAVIMAVEIFLRTNIRTNVAEMFSFMKRSTSTIASARISDHWKEKVLVHYSFMILINSLQLFLYLLLIFSPIVAIHLVASQFETDLISLLITPLGLIVSIVFASCYMLVRSKVLHVGL